MTLHTIKTELEVETAGGVFCPKLEITYSYLPGSPAVYYQRNGDPGWPADPAELELINVKLIDGNGLDPTDQQVQKWANDWLDDAGYSEACGHAEECLSPDHDD